MVFLEKILVGELLIKMRIISGKLKGKNLQFLKSQITRPLKDSIKESIFNILAHSKNIGVSVEGADIIDLYSGVGSFGLECISRNAKTVTFIEKDTKAFKMLFKNIEKLSVKNNSLLFNDRIENVFKRLKKKYKIFFFDPPFNDESYIKNLKKFKENQMFYKDHIVIIHREKKTREDLVPFLNLIFEREYGRSKIIFATFN